MPVAGKHSRCHLHVGMHALEENNISFKVYYFEKISTIRNLKCLESFPFNLKFHKFRNGDKWYGNFPGNFAKDLEVIYLIFIYLFLFIYLFIYFLQRIQRLLNFPKVNH